MNLSRRRNRFLRARVEVAICVLPWISGVAAAQAQPPVANGSVVYECENNICGTWTWDNGNYDGHWANGSIATLTVQSFSVQSVTLTRTDTSKSASSGLTAVYTGQVSSQGNSIVNGSVTYTWPGHGGFPKTVAWSGNWGASAKFTITTVAGNGSVGDSGDDGPATSAALASPLAIAVDPAGNLYIADQANNRIRKVIPDGTITTIAGTGVAGFGGDGGPATAALLNQPTNVFVDAMGDILIADQFNGRIRKISNGIITTVAGNGSEGYCGDGGPATSACLGPEGTLDVVADVAGNFYIADVASCRIRKVTNGIINTFAGNGICGYSGDGGPATSASLSAPQSMALNSAGELFIADLNNSRIRKVTGGIISTVAGTGVAGYSGDGGPATSAAITYPRGLCVDNSGNVYFSDHTNNVVRVLLRNGTIFTVAGNFSSVYSGDNGPATIAGINPWGIAIASSGAVYVSDRSNERIRLLTPMLQTPAISAGGVVSASAFGEFASVAPGSWIEIYGSNLASNTRGWAGSDFDGVNAPTSLDGTSVTIGSESAFVDYISPGQVNAQVPSNIATGIQQIIVKTAGGTSSPFNITVNTVQPGLLAPASFNLNGIQYVWAVFPDGTFVLPEGAISGVSSRPAKPGDTIILYGIGFGPVTPDIPAGQIVQEGNMLSDPLQISVGGTLASLSYSGLASTLIGLYQFNVVVPDVAAGDAAPLTLNLNGTGGTQTLYIAVQN